MDIDFFDSKFRDRRNFVYLDVPFKNQESSENARIDMLRRGWDCTIPKLNNEGIWVFEAKRQKD